MCVLLPDNTPVAVTGDTVLRVWPLDNLQPDAAWEPMLQIDLDAPVTALDTDDEGTLMVGTRQGLVRLHLRSRTEVILGK
ncbi:hypothetical protein ACFQ1S_01370 [Kibdelosporangium lantanae]|uniref:WD40 repeat domain-containing protein n=1 Tax=Kibdelosporangium lantanae TaxID=1497396 RepID=A0ABW3M226_9PSEU